VAVGPQGTDILPYKIPRSRGPTITSKFGGGSILHLSAEVSKTRDECGSPHVSKLTYYIRYNLRRKCTVTQNEEPSFQVSSLGGNGGASFRMDFLVPISQAMFHSF
jgi:hypothetical protein